MSFNDFLKKRLIDFFIIVTCISAVIGIIGLIYEPNRRFGYEAYFSPLIFGAISIIPSFVTYSNKELTLKQMIFRNAIQLLILECLILITGYSFGAMKDKMILTSVAFSVIIVFIIVHLISWVIDSKTASILNENLKVYQKNDKKPF
ncbi:MAG: hypothetical protein WBJ13_01640 [Sedimentibacter sp.]